MSVNLIVGSSSFVEFKKRKALFIDKSLLIEEFITSGSKVDLVLRPRRFGKSLNLSMMEEFFRIGNNPQLFNGMKISEKKEIMEEYCGKSPVLLLDLKDVVGTTWDAVLQKLWKAVCRMARKHRGVLKRNYPNQDPFGFDVITDVPPPSKAFVQDSLSNLMEILNECHNEQVIVLIDEYDAPLNNAYREGFYEQAVKFFGTFFSMALKGNESLGRAFMVGIAEIGGSGLLTQFNNAQVYSYLSKEYSSYFGFAIEEVQLLGIEGKDLENLIYWYNGYYFGGVQVLNPWSVMTWLRRNRQFACYWKGTSATTSLQQYLQGQEKILMIEIFVLLYDGDPFHFEFDNMEVSYSKSDWNFKSIMNFLVLTGYLTYNNMEVMVPNYEVEQYLKNNVLSIVNKLARNMYGAQVEKVFNDNNFNHDELKTLMEEIIKHASSYDLARRNYSEAVFHCLFFGIFLASIHNGDNVNVQSNKEAGKDRFDIRITISDKRKAFIFEFKVIDSDRSDALDNASATALQQLSDRDYCHGLNGYSCHLLGVAFYRKTLQLKYKNKQQSLLTVIANK